MSDHVLNDSGSNAISTLFIPVQVGRERLGVVSLPSCYHNEVTVINAESVVVILHGLMNVSDPPPLLLMTDCSRRTEILVLLSSL